MFPSYRALFVKLVSRRGRSERAILLIALTLIFLSFYNHGDMHHAAPARPSRAPLATDRFALPFVNETKLEWAKQLAKHYHDQTTVPDVVSSKHRFQSNGLLQASANPSARHPIPDLIAFAQRKWETKLKRASKTLSQAVAEYQRRYHRLPPKGFDIWWKYVQEHNVQLPDEYDQIYHDLEPFWGMVPAHLNHIQGEFESRESFTMGKMSGSDPVSILNATLPDGLFNHMTSGGKGIMDLLRPIEQHLPPFRAVLLADDNPTHFFDYELRQAAVEHAEMGTYIDIFNTQIRTKWDGWMSACSPQSPIWNNPPSFDEPFPVPSSTSQTKSFVFDDRKAGDPCLNPEILRQHGQFLSWTEPKMGPIPPGHLTPSFAYSPSQMHMDITLAHTVSWLPGAFEPATDVPWEQKHDERLEWRGKNTGITHTSGTDWESSVRVRMMDWAMQNMGDNITLLNWMDDRDPADVFVTLPKARLAPAMVDMGFIGPPIQCEEPVCGELVDRFGFFASRHQEDETFSHKYILDVDGNGWSSRFRRLIRSHSLIFKSSVYMEWWADRAQPWVHYVPVKNDMSDLWDSLVWFRGGLNGEGGHDAAAKKIAEDGSKWADTFWRAEDMTAYNFRLFLEYGRVMSSDRFGMSYHDCGRWDHSSVCHS